MARGALASKVPTSGDHASHLEACFNVKSRQCLAKVIDVVLITMEDEVENFFASKRVPKRALAWQGYQALETKTCLIMLIIDSKCTAPA